MRVAIGALARAGLESRVGTDLPAAVNAALVFYVGKLESGRGVAPFPKFLAEQGIGDRTEDDEAIPQLEVDVDPGIEIALEREAAAQGVDIAELARHAVLVYLAELDLIGDPKPAPAGRVPA
jgi:hypothetical protein